MNIRDSRILVAEDQSIVRAIIVQMLKGLGVGFVVGVADGRAAWMKLTDHPDGFDLLITDLDMPVMSGAELAEKIRDSYSPGYRLPVIVLTADEKQRGMTQLGGYPVFRCLIKPVSVTALREAVEEGLVARAHAFNSSEKHNPEQA